MSRFLYCAMIAPTAGDVDCPMDCTYCEFFGGIEDWGDNEIMILCNKPEDE